MRADAMARLRAADPVRAIPAVEPPERLRTLIEGDDAAAAAAAAGTRVRRGRPRRTRRLLLGALILVAASGAGLLLGSGSSDPGVNVAAAAYAATSPRSGIVEAVFLARSFRPAATCAGSRWCSASPSSPETLRQREWLDGATGQRRELDTIDAPHAKPPFEQASDAVFGPHVTEEWTEPGGSGAVRVKHLPASDLAQRVVRIQAQLHRAIEHIAFAGIALDGVEGIDLFRHLYRMGWMRLVGRVQHGSERLWKLESRPLGRSGETVRARRMVRTRERTRLIVLVDPRSFLPVAEMQLDVSDPAHPYLVVESRLVSYRRLATDAATLRLFDLAAQHPRARVIRSREDLPRFRAARR